MAYSASHNHEGPGIMVTKIKTEFHARISTTNNKNPRPNKASTALVIASMNDRAMEVTHAIDIRNNWLSILTSGYNQPSTNILSLFFTIIIIHSGSAHSPHTTSFIIASTFHLLVEHGPDSKSISIRIQVTNELILSWVGRKFFRE